MPFIVPNSFTSSRLQISETHRKRIEKRKKEIDEFLSIIEYKIKWSKENGGIFINRNNTYIDK